MTIFEEILLRLKKQLNIRTDKDIAMLLGLKPTSFNDRKKRDTFPIDKLRLLAVNQPELNIDLEYVLTGKPSERMTRKESKRLGVAVKYGLLAGYEEDGDTSRDGERFNTATAASYRLSADEVELLSYYQQSALIVKHKVKQALMVIDLASKTPADYQPSSMIATQSAENIYPLNPSEWEFIKRFRCADFILQSTVTDWLLVERPLERNEKISTTEQYKQSSSARAAGQHFHSLVIGEQFVGGDINNNIIKKKE